MEKFFTKIESNSSTPGQSSTRSSHAISLDKGNKKRACIEVEVSDDDYRARLTTVVRVARYLLGEGLGFRGHDESEESMHRGHFLELISWFCKYNEEANKVMQSNAPKNNQMTSSTIQRQIIEAYAKETRKVIFNDIGDRFFSLLLDEVQDSSMKEQIAIVLRYVNDSGVVIERFVGVVHVTETSAQCLKSAVDEFFAKNGLSLLRVRGQGYNGASNMRGELNGLKSLILNENKHAHYIHCFAYQLQLVVVSAAEENDDVSQFFEYVSMIVNMVGGSCKTQDALRQLHYEEVVKKIQSGEISSGNGKHKEIGLAQPGTTRWGSHYKTLLRLFDKWNSVEEVLLAINKDGDTRKNRGMAKGLLNKMGSFEFVFVGKLMLYILGVTDPVSKILQAKDQNIGTVICIVEALKKNLQTYREDGWKNLLKKATEFCVQQKIKVPNMDDIVESRSRTLIDGEPITHFHHFRMEIFAKVIDEVALELNNRFNGANTDLLRGIRSLDPSNSFVHFDHNEILNLAGLYSDDFSSVELAELHYQLEFYIFDVKENPEFSNLDNVGALAKKMVENKYHICFPLVYRLIELALVLPVATATIERCFSAMNIVNTDLCNRLGDELLSDCLLCYIEKDIFISIDEEAILQCFQKLASRKNYLKPPKSSHATSTSSSSSNRKN